MESYESVNKGQKDSNFFWQSAYQRPDLEQGLDPNTGTNLGQRSDPDP
jgi:hypothetical protein